MLQTVKYLIGARGPSGYGSKSTAEDVTENCGDLRSVTAIITGATSGIGAETARVLAKRGARVVIPARSMKAAEDTKARILSECPDATIIVMALDLSSLRSVRSFVAEFESLDLPLNLLMYVHRKTLVFVWESVYYPFSVWLAAEEIRCVVFGHFLLTNLLLKKMIETARETGVQGRIVNVSSAIHGWFAGDMLQYLEEISGPKCPHYDATRAYALSKLANVLHTKHLALTLKEMDANVTVNSVHPGIVRTRLTREREGFMTDAAFFLASKLLKTIPQAAATTCYVATHPRLGKVSGKYFADCNEATVSKLGSSSMEAAQLWSASEIMVSSSSFTHPKAPFLRLAPTNR
ncbi:Short-chain dehydrogenase TIC 32 A, chloroplastic [Linum perenne]